jgi:hypothetical protein
MLTRYQKCDIWQSSVALTEKKDIAQSKANCNGQKSTQSLLQLKTVAICFDRTLIYALFCFTMISQFFLL